jgi:hypothetical protein
METRFEKSMSEFPDPFHIMKLVSPEIFPWNARAFPAVDALGDVKTYPVRYATAEAPAPLVAVPL